MFSSLIVAILLATPFHELGRARALFFNSVDDFTNFNKSETDLGAVVKVVLDSLYYCGNKVCTNQTGGIGRGVIIVTNRLLSFLDRTAVLSMKGYQFQRVHRNMGIFR